AALVARNWLRAEHTARRMGTRRFPRETSAVAKRSGGDNGPASGPCAPRRRGGHQPDDFGAAPFHFGAMPICHRGQIVVDGTVVGRERERDFGFSRGPLLAA